MSTGNLTEEGGASAKAFPRILNAMDGHKHEAPDAKTATSAPTVKPTASTMDDKNKGGTQSLTSLPSSPPTTEHSHRLTDAPTQTSADTAPGRGGGRKRMNPTVPTGYPTSAPSHAPTLRRGYLETRKLSKKLPEKESQTDKYPSDFFEFAGSFSEGMGFCRALLWCVAIVVCIYMAQERGANIAKRENNAEISHQFLPV